MSWIAAQTRIPKRALNKTQVTVGGRRHTGPLPLRDL